jgi:hypothetical protein
MTRPYLARPLLWRPAGSLLVAILLAIGITPAADAHRKTDVITLYNGDRITGEIKSLQGGRVSFGTDAMGTINVEWKEVASLSSVFYYEVRMIDGQRFYGSLSEGEAPGSVTLKDVFGEQQLGWQDIVELRPIEDEAIDRLDVYLSANYAFTKASGVTQTELRANVAYEDERARNTLQSRATVSDTDEETTASTRINVTRMVWTDRRAMYRVLFGGHETNDELGLDQRITVGAGLGRYLYDTNNLSFNAGAGLQALTERGTDGSQQESVEAVLFATFSRWRFDSPELDLSIDGQLFPSLSESGRLRADTNATLRWEIVSDLYWNLSAWGSYDNESVDAEGGEFDWGITTGLGWSF